MQLVDRGSRCPCINFDYFILDSKSIKEVRSFRIKLHGFVSLHNCIVDRYILVGFQVEAEGKNLFTQKFIIPDILLLHPHPIMLYDALTHASLYSKVTPLQKFHKKRSSTIIFCHLSLAAMR